MKKIPAKRTSLEKPDFRDDDVFLCQCGRVTESEIIAAIRCGGLKTVDEVKGATRACQGCQTCMPEIEGLLEQVWLNAERTGFDPK